MGASDFSNLPHIGESLRRKDSPICGSLEKSEAPIFDLLNLRLM